MRWAPSERTREAGTAGICVPCLSYALLAGWLCRNPHKSSLALNPGCHAHPAFGRVVVKGRHVGCGRGKARPFIQRSSFVHKPKFLSARLIIPSLPSFYSSQTCSGHSPGTELRAADTKMSKRQCSAFKVFTWQSRESKHSHKALECVQ